MIETEIWNKAGPAKVGKIGFSSGYIRPVLGRIISSRQWPHRRAFDLGCGNGTMGRFLVSQGFAVTGVDPSSAKVAFACAAQPPVAAHVGSGYDDLRAQYGQFPLVMSLEVIEHCMAPRQFLKTFLDLIEPGGMRILSTPYHGYLKNLSLAVTGRLDKHFNVMAEGGHIKFFSLKTLKALFRTQGADNVEIRMAGRFPPFSKSMIAVVKC